MDTEDILEEFKIKYGCVPEKAAEKWDIYAEREFGCKTFVHNWWYHREGYPKDYDDIVNAAYKRLGSLKEDKSRWTTETKQAMADGLGDPQLIALSNQVKPLRMLTFLSYPITLKTRKDLLPEEIKKILPSLPRDVLTLRYTTTNQAHYKKVHIHPK